MTAKERVLAAIRGVLVMLLSQLATSVGAQQIPAGNLPSPYPACHWNGNSPFCNGDCDAGQRDSGVRSDCGDGACCLTGTKHQCCVDPPHRNEIHSSTSPFRCLDADLGTIGANGTKVGLWDCWGGQNQKWQLNTDGTIVNLQSHRCLDADLGTIGANGGKVQLWDCWGGQNPHQKWAWLVAGDHSGGVGGVYLWNLQSNTCLDADLGTIGANGTKVQLWECWNRNPGGKSELVVVGSTHL